MTHRIANSSKFPVFCSCEIGFDEKPMNTDIMRIKEVAAYLKLTEKTPIA